MYLDVFRSAKIRTLQNYAYRRLTFKSWVARKSHYWQSFTRRNALLSQSYIVNEQKNNGDGSCGQMSQPFVSILKHRRKFGGQRIRRTVKSATRLIPSTYRRRSHTQVLRYESWHFHKLCRDNAWSTKWSNKMQWRSHSLLT